MKSVIEFNDDQKKMFKILADDAIGPTSIWYVLQTLEEVANELAQPDLDPKWVSKESAEKFEVCMCTLEFMRMFHATEE